MKTFVLLLTLALLAIPSAARNVDDDVSFSGTWKTIAGGTHQYTVILKQIGNEVTGSYSPGNGKIFDGVVNNNKLRFKWTQDGGYEGLAVFTMDEDGKGFTGSSSALKPTEFTVTWNSYRAPVTSFAGIWETVSGSQYSVPLTIVQTGNSVTGLYPDNHGKIEGTVEGKVLRFKWESDGGTGSGRFVMDESGRAFNGTYNRGDNPDEVEATWNGKRAPVSFAGEWNVVWNGQSNRLVLGQVGNQVKGLLTLLPVSNTFYVKEGLVDGNKLTFKVSETRVEATGEFVMDEGGKSFKGTVNSKSVTGTFVGPVQPKDKSFTEP